MMLHDDRRHFWRAHFHSHVQLAMHGETTAAELLDISLKGALIEVPVAWRGQLDDRCQFRLHLAPHTTIGMSMVVAHIDGRRVGLSCDNIDVDSVTHLRRLVELNAGDPDLLDRELSALLHEKD